MIGVKNSEQKATAATESADQAFHIRTLGEVSPTDMSGQPARLRTRRSLLPLTCLASQPDRSWPREKLAALFWSDRQDEQARNSHRSALSDIRRVLGKDALVVEGNSVTLTSGVVATDIWRLLAQTNPDLAGDSGDLPAFYSGDFLADTDEGPEAIDWISGLRTECRDLAASVLEDAITSPDSGGSKYLNEPMKERHP